MWLQDHGIMTIQLGLILFAHCPFSSWPFLFLELMAPVPPWRHHGYQFRGWEIHALLNLVENIMPISSQNWQSTGKVLPTFTWSNTARMLVWLSLCEISVKKSVKGLVPWETPTAPTTSLGQSGLIGSWYRWLMHRLVDWRHKRGDDGLLNSNLSDKESVLGEHFNNSASVLGEHFNNTAVNGEDVDEGEDADEAMVGAASGAGVDEVAEARVGGD
jgi:hypothetical protein